MMRKFLTIALLALIVQAGGCAGNEEVRQNTERLSALEKETSGLTADMQQMHESLERLSASLESLERTVDEAERPMRIKEGTTRAAEKVREIDSKLDMLESIDPSGIRVKVLVGSGDARSGERMAALLRGRGYDVGAVDKAPSRFKRMTVYYAEGFDEAGFDLAEDLGAVLKPLSWSSVFDLIVVTGKGR